MKLTAEKQIVESAAEKLHEKAETEQSEDNRRHAGQVVDCAADDAGQRRVGFRVLSEINRRDHADR